MMIEKLRKDKLTLELHIEEHAESPREWDNIGTLKIFHRRYLLGDKVDIEMEDAEKILRSKDYIALPVYMLDHSGIRIKTTPFGCPWDSGQVGLIYVSKTDVRREYSCKVVSKNLRENIENILRSEVKTYNDYVSGHVYGYRLLDDDGDEVDSCWGFYGSDHEKSGLFESAGWN